MCLVAIQVQYNGGSDIIYAILKLTVASIVLENVDFIHQSIPREENSRIDLVCT
jgi:hypothetical protein